MGDPKDGKYAIGYIQVCIAAAGLVSACAWLLLYPGPDSCAGLAAAAITLIEVLRARNKFSSIGLELNLLRTWRLLTPIVSIIMFWALIREIFHTPALLILDQNRRALLLALLMVCGTMIVLRALSSKFGKPEMPVLSASISNSATVIQIDEINSVQHHYHAPPQRKG